MRHYLVGFFTVLLSVPASALYTPQQALKDISSEKLQYVGAYMPAASETQKYPTCLFKNSKVLVESSYCVKGDVPAARLVIHQNDHTKGYVRIYAEIDSVEKDISQAQRADYLNFQFAVSAHITHLPFSVDMTPEKYKEWEEEETKMYSRFCVTAEVLNDRPYSTVCKDLDQLNTWGPHGQKFWNESDPLFAAVLKMIKAEVR